MNTLNNNFKDPTWGWTRMRSDPTWGCHRQSSFLPRPQRQVALGSAPRKGRAAHASCGAQSAPCTGRAAKTPAVLAWATPVPGAHSPCSPTKTCADNFILNHSFNAKCTPVKKTTPSLLRCHYNSMCQGLSCHYTILIHSALCLYFWNTIPNIPLAHEKVVTFDLASRET
jgi:hypothetical protein